MRSFAILAILLLSGCASKGGIVTLDTPLCPSARVDPPPAAVRIQIDAVSKKVNPKTCYVVSDTEVWGRPVGVAVAQDGALIVTDDASNIVWRIAASK